MAEQDGCEHPVCRTEKPQAESLKIYSQSSRPRTKPEVLQQEREASEIRCDKTKCLSVIQMGCCANRKYDTTQGRLDMHMCIRQVYRQGGFPTGKDGVRFTVCPFSPRWWWTVEHLSFTLALFADGSWKQRIKGQGGMVQHPVLSSIIMAGGVPFLSEIN